jgi:acyl-CoA thioester hydrolase
MSHRSEPAGPFRFRLAIEPRFGDTDAMGHVNNAVYLTYFEVARAGYYRAVTGGMFGIGSSGNPKSFIVAEARVAYRSPVLYPEPLVLECRAGWVSRSAFGLEYRISTEASPHGAARLAAYGETVQVMYDYGAGRVTRLPRELVDALAAWEGRPLPERPDTGPAGRHPMTGPDSGRAGSIR